MPKLKHLSGKQVLAFCKLQGFELARQKGSHLNLMRLVAGRKQVVTVPNHKEIDRGTLANVYKQLGRYIPDDQLWEFFYTNDK